MADVIDVSCDGLIKSDIAKNCDDPMTEGLEPVSWIVNREHIDWDALEYKSRNESSNLPLLSGKRAYRVKQTGAKPYDTSNKTIEVGTQGGSVTTQIRIFVPDIGPEVSRDIIDPLMDGAELVQITENKHKRLRDTTNPGGSAFELHGLHNGLKLSEGSRPFYDDDALGAWVVTIQETKAPVSGLFLNAGSYKATKTLIETLVAGAEA
jgi:hypothetical protein